MIKTQFLSLVLKSLHLKQSIRNNSEINLRNAKNLNYKNLDYYRKINASGNKINLEEWNQAQPFEKLPGPKALPLIGNTWRFYFPIIGDFYKLDYLDIHEILHKKYGDIAIIKSVLGRKPLILLFNPKDIEKLHRNEGVWPIRRGFPSIRAYRNLRKEFIPKEGLMTLDGEEWYKFRTLINPILMKPKNITQYTDSINTVTDQLLDNIKYYSQQNFQNMMPENFEDELHKWALESVGVVMMDNHFGCLNRNLDESSEAKKLVKSVLNVFNLMFCLDHLPAFWRFVTTPTWRQFVQNLDFVLHTSLKHINKRLDELENDENLKKEEVQSVLYQLLKIDRDYATTWSAEMIFAGIDTTAKILSACLYYLSKNPHVQEKLRHEATTLLKSKTSKIDNDVLSKAEYLKAVIKETTRLAPITTGNLRVTRNDCVLGGYQIPAGIHVQTSYLLLCRKDEHFPNALDFIPERWLKSTKNQLSYRNTNRFVFAPFGYGTRSCIGKRLANLELQIAILKVSIETNLSNLRKNASASSICLFISETNLSFKLILFNSEKDS